MARIAILTIGSRGDIQPFCAIALGLVKAGHDVILGGSPDFAGFVGRLGLAFAPIGGNFKQFMGSPIGLDIVEGKKSNPLTDELLWKQMLEAWQIAQGSDLIVYSALTSWGYHIAEALQVSGILAAPFPLAPTKAFPILKFAHRSDQWLPGLANLMSYRLAYVLSWRRKAKILNQFRRDVLNLSQISSWQGPLYGRDTALPMTSLPILNCYSAAVIPPAPDWGTSVHQVGHCFLDAATDFSPSAELQDFLNETPKPFYVGFGSMIVRDPQQLAQKIVSAITATGQRAVLCSGWGDIGKSELSASIYKLTEIPHDWLFPKVAAVIHHAGAGTTAATLRAGIPSIAIPFFADQPVWAALLEQLGVSPATHPRLELESDRLSLSITTILENDSFYQKAQQIKAQIETEDSVAKAVSVIESYLNR